MTRPIRTQLLQSTRETSQFGAVLLAGIIRQSLGVGPAMRVLGSYALVYLLHGSGRYEDARGRRQDVSAGDLLVIYPEIAHCYGPAAGQGWDEIYLVFTGSVFTQWRSAGLLDERQPVWHAQPVDYWRQRMEAVVNPRVPGPHAGLVQVCRLQHLLADLLSGAGGAAQRGEQVWAQRACAILDAQLETALDLERVAEQLGMSYETFRKRFVQILGQPPARYRAVRVMEQACRWMAQGQLSDKQIARRLSFCDEFHFSRRFKQITGLSPREYRRRLPM